MMMCALGYASVVEDLIYTYAIGDEPGVPFPAAAIRRRTPRPLRPGSSRPACGR